MSADEIVADLLTKEFDKETTRALLDDFVPPPDADRITAICFHFAHSEFSRWIRNAYGLWDESNPHVLVNAPPNSEGIIDHPLFPDNFSGMIEDRFIAAFKEKYRYELSDI